ncbi:MAG: ABC transporter substrate-binding protein [Peptostreptococcaceae bacterium]
MKFTKLASLAVVGALFLTGCASDDSTETETTEETQTEILSIVHDSGTTDVSVDPQRVVVFDFAMLDTMANLGLQDRVVGVAQSSSVPVYLSEFTDEKYGNVGTLKDIDLEAVNALEPDLIVTSGRQVDFYDQLSEIAPTIELGTDGTKYWEELTYNNTTLAGIFGMEDELDSKLEEINEKVAEIKAQVEEQDVDAMTILASEGSLNVLGSGSRFGFVYNQFGFKSNDEGIDESNHGNNVSYEYIATQNPDYIIAIDKDDMSGEANQEAARGLLNNDLVNNTTAGQEGNIIYVNTASWYLSPGGLTSTMQMVEDISSGINK